METGLQLNSVLAFNYNYRSLFDGYILNISVKFCEPFQSAYTRDGLLWLFIIRNSQIIHQYSLHPSTTSLLQTFSIPYGTLDVCLADYVSIGTYGYNQSASNTVCLLQTGNYATNEIDINNPTLFNPKWNGDQYGIALSYTAYILCKYLYMIV